MLVSFTQTYGDKRFELHDIHLRDTRLLLLKEFFDVNIYSFHNVPDKIRSNFVEKLPQERMMVITNETPHYATTMERIRNDLNKMRATHVLFTQDDTFSDDNEDIDWRELLNYVQFYSKDFFLSLRYSPDDFTVELEPDMQFGTFGIHRLDVRYWMEHGLWAMDDEPFICTIDVFNELYNDERLSKMDVWSMEIFLRKVWEKKPNALKFVTDRQLLRNYNLHGMNTADKKYYRELLEEKKLISGAFI